VTIKPPKLVGPLNTSEKVAGLKEAICERLLFSAYVGALI
jgi:hypothetical protein